MGSLEDKIKAKAIEAGYESCGIIEASLFEEFLVQLNTRSTLFPHAGPFYDRLRRLANPKESIEWAKSIIVCLRRYDRYKIPEGLERFVGKVFLVDSRLSYSKEYAGTVEFEQFLDGIGLKAIKNAAPARWSAVKAGLGKFRNNNFVYTKRGSWNWIDTWVIDKQMEYEIPIDDARFACPDSCNRCIKACPTAALSDSLTMDGTCCIAHLSCAANLLPSENLRDKMGTWLYGCDVCQNVCPANSGTWQENEKFPEPSRLKDIITLEDLFLMDEETYWAKVQPRFWYISKDDIWQWKCNALRAMANMDSPKYEKYFIRALADHNENVREIASWAQNKAK